MGIDHKTVILFPEDDSDPTDNDAWGRRVRSLAFFHAARFSEQKNLPYSLSNPLSLLRLISEETFIGPGRSPLGPIFSSGERIGWSPWWGMTDAENCAVPPLLPFMFDVLVSAGRFNRRVTLLHSDDGQGSKSYQPWQMFASIYLDTAWINERSQDCLCVDYRGAVNYDEEDKETCRAEAGNGGWGEDEETLVWRRTPVSLLIPWSALQVDGHLVPDLALAAPEKP